MCRIDLSNNIRKLLYFRLRINLWNRIFKKTTNTHEFCQTNVLIYIYINKRSNTSRRTVNIVFVEIDNQNTIFRRRYP